MKKCNRCQKEQPFDNFHRSKDKSDGRDTLCKSCKKVYRAQHYLSNKSLYHEKYRRAYLKNTVEFLQQNANRKYKHRYGITQGEKNQMVKDQGGKCLICEKPFKNTKDQCIDHNHKTKKVRAILCDSCNKGLGCFYDDFELLMKAVKYLLSFKNV